MSESTKSGGELFIVDNSDESWKGIKYLQDWTEIASAFDIATGYYEIGALLALDGRSGGRQRAHRRVVAPSPIGRVEISRSM